MCTIPLYSTDDWLTSDLACLFEVKVGGVYITGESVQPAHQIPDKNHLVIVLQQALQHAAGLLHSHTGSPIHHTVYTGQYTHTVYTGQYTHTVYTGQYTHTVYTGQYTHTQYTGQYTHTHTVYRSIHTHTQYTGQYITQCIQVNTHTVYRPHTSCRCSSISILAQLTREKYGGRSPPSPITPSPSPITPSPSSLPSPLQPSLVSMLPGNHSDRLFCIVALASYGMDQP